MLKPSKNFLAALIASSFAFGLSAHAEESLACDLSRRGAESASLALAAKIIESQSVVQDTKNDLSLRVDASLAAGSFIFMMQDDSKQQRIAFTGAPGAVAWDGARISTSSTEFNCRKKSTEPAKSIPPVSRTEFNYLVCLLDEATFENGAITKTERLAQTVSSADTFRLARKIEADTARAAFSVNTNPIDPLNGLAVVLYDKTNGEIARYAGPSGSLKSSFMFGFTQGSREASAKFLRMGCAYTDDPKLFLETK